MNTLSDKVKSTALPVEPIGLPLYDVTVFAHAMTGRERADYQQALRERQAAAEAADTGRNDLADAGLIIARCIRDADGAPVFTDEDALTLADAMHGALFERLLAAVFRVNRMTDADEADAKKKVADPGWNWWLRMAWHCGVPHPDRLWARLTPLQLTEVQAFAAVVPLPEQRADERAAMQCVIAARAAGSRSAELADFLPPEAVGADEPQTPDQIERAFDRWAATAAEPDDTNQR